MWEQAVVTNVGAQVLAKWAAGGTLIIDSAKAGAGTVDVTRLREQTALTEEKATLSIVGKKAQDTGTEFRVQLQAASAAYTAKQIGIFGHLGTGNSVLLALYQDETGIAVPSKAEMPDFVYAFYATIQGSNTGDISVTVDASALVSKATLETAVAEMQESVDAASAKADAAAATADSKPNVYDYKATFLASGWSDTAPYTQSVSFGGTLKSTDTKPILALDMENATADTAEDLQAAWSCIGRATAEGSTLTAYCFTDKPETDIPVMMKVVE